MKRPALLAATAATAALVLAACGTDDRPEKAATGQTMNRTDADFISEMNQLLNQATTMAGAASERASDPQVRQLAASMNGRQSHQFDAVVAMMDDVEKSGVEMAHDHGASADGIPGFLGDAERDRMDALKGRPYDEAFLRLMIKHHEGAFTLIGTERAEGAFQPAKDLAAQIESDFTQQNLQMRDLLNP